MKRRHFWVVLSDGIPFYAWEKKPPPNEIDDGDTVVHTVEVEEDRAKVVQEPDDTFILEVEANVFVDWAGGTTTRSDRARFVCADDARAFASAHGWEVVE